MKKLILALALLLAPAAYAEDLIPEGELQGLADSFREAVSTQQGGFILEGTANTPCQFLVVGSFYGSSLYLNYNEVVSVDRPSSNETSTNLFSVRAITPNSGSSAAPQFVLASEPAIVFDGTYRSLITVTVDQAQNRIQRLQGVSYIARRVNQRMEWQRVATVSCRAR